MNKKFYLLGLCVAASATVANAQQLPNVGFEHWKDACGITTWTSTMYDKGSDFTRPGVEPAYWNGSSVTSFNMSMSTISNSNNSVEIKNYNISIPFFDVNQTVPGYLTLATPWVFVGGTGMLNANNYAKYGDGGSYGGVEFSNRPDAIKLRYQKTTTTETSHVVAYLWAGEFKSNVPSSVTDDGVYTYGKVLTDVDRVVLGRQTDNVTATGKLIAKMDKGLSELTEDWVDLEIPFEYVDMESVPEKMNVIISSADYWTRANLQANSTLLVDDVDFVYYSTLTALEVNGETVELEEGKYEYSMTGSELPTAEQVVAKAKSQFAEAAVTVDSENAQVRIVVTNQGGKDVDGETLHTYVLQYEKAEIEGTPYAGYLNIEMAGEPLAYNQAANIEIAETGEGVCTFMLPDFQFMGQSLGDIVVENVSIIEGEDGVKTYSGSTPEDGNLVLVPGITASVSLTGTIDASGNCDFTIDVLWIESELPISVTFTTEMVGTDYEGYLNVSSEALGGQLVDNQWDAIRIAQTSDNTCTFMLNDLTLSILGSDITLGDIVVDNVNVVETDGVKHYNGTAEGLQLVVGPVNVEVEGTIDANNICDFKIDVDWNGMPINVTFTANKIPAGIEGVSGDAVAVYGVVGAVSVNGYNGVVEVYAADGRLVKSVMVDGNAEISLNGGLYIVRAGSEAYKVFVK